VHENNLVYKKAAWNSSNVPSNSAMGSELVFTYVQCEIAKCNANKCEKVPVTDVYTYKCAGTQYVCGPAEGDVCFVP
jgi:hypothetical protein